MPSLYTRDMVSFILYRSVCVNVASLLAMGAVLAGPVLSFHLPMHPRSPVFFSLPGMNLPRLLRRLQANRPIGRLLQTVMRTFLREPIKAKPFRHNPIRTNPETATSRLLTTTLFDPTELLLVDVVAALLDTVLDVLVHVVVVPGRSCRVAAEPICRFSDLQ